MAEVDDEDMECEDGASPALLGGFIVPAYKGDDVDIEKQQGHYQIFNGNLQEEQ